MKKSLLAIALAVATTPFMFAAPAPKKPAKTAATTTTATKTKKVKKAKKAKTPKHAAATK